MKISLDFFKTFIQALNNEPPSDIPLESFRNHIKSCQLIILNPSETGIKFPLENKVLRLALEVCELLFKRLRQDSVIIEPQFLCAKTLYAYINILPIELKIKYLDNIHILLCEYSRQKEDTENYWGQILNFPTAAFTFVSDVPVMSLINGFFNFDMERVENPMLRNLCEKILQESLKITVKSCMKYSNTTFVSFRNLSSILNKMLEKNIVEKISDDVVKALSYVILYNWESPFAGIKDYNSDILKSYLELIGDSIEQFLDDVLNFPWNKAKYFCLCEILPFLRSKRVDISYLNDQLVKGLKYSLHNCYLVSAGAEFYKIMLEGLSESNQWYDLFFNTFNGVLMGNNQVAKQNILNHWLPVTVRKYPSVITLLINNFLDLFMKEKVEYGFLHILKIARKSGLLLQDWNDKSYNELIFKKSLRIALNHIDEDIRMQAFQIVCCTYKVSSLPAEEEFNIFKDFFANNVNYDSTSFRQSLLSCFTDFLVHLRDSYLHITKSGESQPKNEEHVLYIFRVEDYFVWLYEFIYSNIKDSANYQRKFTSLQMLDITMRYLSYVDNEIYKNRRKSNQRYLGWKIMERLKKHSKWSFEDEKFVSLLTNCLIDPTNDIHNAAVSILSQYYSENQYLRKSKNNLFIMALVMCNSKLFYEVESGCAIIRLLTKQYIFGDQDIQVLIDPKFMFLDMLQYMIEKCQQQFTYHKEDVLLSICNGQPLHGILSAINAYTKEYRLSISATTVRCLVDLSHDIVTFFLDILSTKMESTDKQYPPSFAEMSLSVDHLISMSKYDMGSSSSTNFESVQTTNVQQLVLNNIWCNLKACCELSSTIINKCCEALSDDYVSKCLEVNTLILIRCRHKGAIESAGVSLGQCVRYITSSQNTTNINLISNILETFLLNVTSSNSVGRSITRRSAGLTILVHRIVTNDMQDGKPLFFKAMKILLNILTGFDSQKQETSEAATTQANLDNLEITNERDIPQATALHLICRTVADSSLTHYIIQFASILLSTCFKYFSSKEWQIRNGALQLYGALVPKLIGQKSRSGEISSKSPMSADELFSHIPRAWQHIISNLRMTYCTNSSKESFLHHSNLVPILSLLSNMSSRYKLQQNGLPPSVLIEMANVDEIFVYLMNLLSSPIYNVRNLCARIIASFYSPIKFYQHWKHSKPSLTKENELHGYLLVLKYYVSYHTAMKEFTSDKQYSMISIILEDIAYSMKEFITNKTSFLCKVVHFEIMRDLKSNCIYYLDVIHASFELAEKCDNKDHDFNVRCGFYLWIDISIGYFIDTCDNDTLVDIIPRCFKNRCILENGLLPALKRRIECNTLKFYVIKIISVELINLWNESNEHLLIDVFEMIYIIITHAPIDLVNVFEPNFIDKALSLCNNDNYNYGYLLPLICQILMKQYTLFPQSEIIDTVSSLSQIAKCLSNVNVYESEVRLYSALTLKHIANILSHLCANVVGSDRTLRKIKNNILSSTFWLLQDEDADVRYESAKILFFSEHTVVHPTKKLKNILTKDFLNKFFSNSDVHVTKFLRILLKEIKDNDTKINEDVFENPFDHNTKNIYWELKIMRNIIWILMPIEDSSESGSHKSDFVKLSAA